MKIQLSKSVLEKSKSSEDICSAAAPSSLMVVEFTGAVDADDGDDEADEDDDDNI